MGDLNENEGITRERYRPVPVIGTYPVDRDELLDTLCSLWCTTLGVPVTRG